MKEIVDESLRQLEEPDREAEAENRAKSERMSKGVAESFIEGVEDGSVDLATVPEKDIPAWYDAVKARLGHWQAKAKQLEDRVPELKPVWVDGKEPSSPPPFFGKRGERSQDQIAAEAEHQFKAEEREAAEKRGAKELRDAERVAETVMDQIDSGEFDLAQVPENDIPGYHKAIMKKILALKNGEKALTDRMMEVDSAELEDDDAERKVA